MRILFTGGGSGGHLSPIAAIARQIIKTSPEIELFYLGPGKFADKFLAKEGIKVKIILAGKIRRYLSLWTILDILKIPIGFLQSLWFVYILMPDVVFSKGGYGAAPVVLVSWLYHIPILIHESDSIPGITNRLGAKLAKKIAISFSSVEKRFLIKKTALIGIPIRPEITEGDRGEGRKIFSINSEKPIILVIGGSQGAQSINEIILITLPQLLEKYEIIHVSGPKNYEDVKNIFNSTPQNKELSQSYHIYSFLEENQLKHAYALSDLIISRAGANTIFEIAACGKPSILIPLSDSAGDHQKENSFEYARSGATVVIEQANLTPHLFVNEIERILSNPELNQKMSLAAKNFSRPEAVLKIADELIGLAR